MASSSTYAFFHYHYAFQKFPFFVSPCIIRLFQSSTCFERTRAHHQEVNCINTASGIVTLCKWSSGLLYFIIRLLQSSTCFERTRAHHQEVNCINTAAGIVTLKTSFNANASSPSSSHSLPANLQKPLK